MASRLLLPPLDVTDGPPATPPLHGLRASARFIPSTSDRWEGGWEFCPQTCMDVLARAPGCDPDGSPSNVAGMGVSFTDPATDQAACPQPLPYMLYVPFECDSLAGPSRNDEERARLALEAGTSKGMERQFWSDPLSTGNYALTSATPNQQGDAMAGTPGILNADAVGTPDAVSPRMAVALLSQALASCHLGSRGMIHAPTALAQLWTGAEGIDLDGERLVTRVRGDVVVVGSGYPGTGPVGNGSATPPAGTAWAYASGMVEYRMSDPDVVSSDLSEVLNRKQNRVEYIAQRMVGEQVDGCCTFAVLVTLV